MADKPAPDDPDAKPKGYKPIPVDPDALPLDLTVGEVMYLRREGPRRVFQKIADGTYEGHKNGETRLISTKSVLADRDRALAKGPQLSLPPGTGNRRPGRPRKPPAKPATAPAERD
jgi:hypothetical protein